MHITRKALSKMLQSDGTMAAALQQAAQTASATASMHAPDVCEIETTQQEAQAAFASASMHDMDVHGPQIIHKKPEAAAAPAGMRYRGLLERCVEGSAPLPEADVESLARQAGLLWVERRGPLLMRTLIAQAPEVSGSQRFLAVQCWQ